MYAQYKTNNKFYPSIATIDVSVGIMNVLLCSFNNNDNKIVFHSQLDSLIVGKYAHSIILTLLSPKRFKLGIALRPLFSKQQLFRVTTKYE